MNGLLKRHAEPTDVPGIVAIVEVWNTAHPDCPIASARRGVRLPNPAQRRCYMYEREARELGLVK